MNVASDHVRTYGSLEHALGYALRETARRPIGCHTVVSRLTETLVVIDRALANNVRVLLRGELARGEP